MIYDVTERSETGETMFDRVFHTAKAVFDVADFNAKPHGGARVLWHYTRDGRTLLIGSVDEYVVPVAVYRAVAQRFADTYAGDSTVRVLREA